MSIDHDEAIRVCFAYNQKGQRCDMPANHSGRHSNTVAWTDAECLDPMELIDAPRFMPVPAVATPPFDGPDHNAVMDQISRAEAAWERRNENVDQEALDALDFGSPAAPPVMVDDRCVACEHRHSGGKCRCGCETHIPKMQ